MNLNSPINPQLLEHEQRRIKLVNAISILSFFSVLAFLVAYLIMDVPELALRLKITSLCALGTLTPIVLNYFKKHLLAKITLSFYDTFAMLMFIVFFRADLTNGHVFFMVYGLIPLFIWSAKDWLYIAFFFGINLICFMGVEFYEFEFNHAIAPSVGSIELFSGLTILMCFLTASIAVAIFHRLAYKKEILLERKNTQIEQQKQELIEVNKDLQVKIGELANNQLKLNQANTIKSKMFSIIAHDLRSPFSSIKGLIEILIEEFDTLKKAEFKNYLNTVNQTTQSTYTLLENLLDWSRLQTNRIKVDPKEVDLHAICQNVVAINSTNISNKSINFENNIPEKLTVFADRYMISTILRNLISNAIKYTPIKGSIKLSATELNNKYIEIQLSDNGIGMSSYEVDMLFSVDSKHTKPGTENEQGTGLGLLICKEFIEMNNGKLTVESEENFGTTFSFTLKACR